MLSLFFFFFLPPSTVFWLGLNAFDFNLECNHILYCFSRIRYGISLYKQANKNPVTFPFFPNLYVSKSLNNVHLKLVRKDVYINDCYPPKALVPLLSLSIVAIIWPDLDGLNGFIYTCQYLQYIENVAKMLLSC